MELESGLLMDAVSPFRRDVQEARDYLLRYARLHLRNEGAVEDVVQDTLMAALVAEASFGGRSNLRTWLTGILKHKIVDAIRRDSREVRFDPESEEDAQIESLFTAPGHWVEHPAAWSDPDAALEQGQFFKVLEACLARLPKKTAQAFTMREHLGIETREICRELAITESHCHVLLYRARMGLQRCLDANWFQR